MEKQEFVSLFEENVLNAMDDIVYTTFDNYNSGWVDSDLPTFLHSIRKQAENVWERVSNKD